MAIVVVVEVIVKVGLEQGYALSVDWRQLDVGMAKPNMKCHIKMLF